MSLFLVGGSVKPDGMAFPPWRLFLTCPLLCFEFFYSMIFFTVSSHPLEEIVGGFFPPPSLAALFPRFFLARSGFVKGWVEHPGALVCNVPGFFPSYLWGRSTLPIGNFFFFSLASCPFFSGVSFPATADLQFFAFLPPWSNPLRCTFFFFLFFSGGPWS